MKKFNFKKDYKHLLSPSTRECEIVRVPPIKYLKIDGQGNPETSTDYRGKMQAIYEVSYTIKLMMNMDKVNPLDYRLSPFSCLWWADDMMAFSNPPRKDEWKWRIMMMQPDLVGTEVIEKARGETVNKKNYLLIDQVYLDTYDEGLCVQIMRIGPYDQKGSEIAKLHKFVYEKGYNFNGYHHEIYLRSPLENSLEKLKTIIRQPIIK